jgi:hypothetical protein
MSKKNSRKSGGSRPRTEGAGSSGTTTASETTDSPTTNVRPKPHRSLTERMVDKVQRALKLIKEVGESLEKKKAPAQNLLDVSNAVVACDALDNSITLLNLSGWKPSTKTSVKDLQEDDSIKILPDKLELYNYIPGLADGTTNLVAGKIILGEGRRGAKVLLKVPSTNADLPPLFYGYAPMSHVALA